MTIDYRALPDEAIARLLGERLRALRLRKNRTQSSVAEATGLSERTVISLEEGRGKLENFIAVLRTLGAMENLDAFLPEPVASPLDLAKRQGQARQRASGSRQKHNTPRRNRDEPW